MPYSSDHTRPVRKKRRGGGPTPPRPWQPMTLAKVIRGEDGDRHVYGNDRYTATVHPALYDSDGNAWTHISLHTHTRATIGAHDWRNLQRIKNELAGREAYAVEVFPPESEVVDTSNEYHLIVFPPGMGLPVDILGGTRIIRDAGEASKLDDNQIAAAAKRLGVDAVLAREQLRRRTKQRKGAGTT